MVYDLFRPQTQQFVNMYGRNNGTNDLTTAWNAVISAVPQEYDATNYDAHNDNWTYT